MKSFINNVKDLEKNRNLVKLEDCQVFLARLKGLRQFLDSPKTKRYIDCRSPFMILEDAVMGATTEIGEDILLFAKLNTLRSGIDYERYKKENPSPDVAGIQVKGRDVMKKSSNILSIKEYSFNNSSSTTMLYSLANYDKGHYRLHDRVSNEVIDKGIISRTDFDLKKIEVIIKGEKKLEVYEENLKRFDDWVKKYINKIYFEPDNGEYLSLLNKSENLLVEEIKNPENKDILTEEMKKFLTSKIGGSSTISYHGFNFNNEENNKIIVPNPKRNIIIKNQILKKRTNKIKSKFDLSKINIPKIEIVKW